VLDAQWLGVPQMRQRVIFIGVRNDLGLKAVYPKPLGYQYSVRDALPWIVTIGTSGGFGHSEQVPSNRAYHTVGTAPQQGNGLARFVEVETDISRYAIGDEWEKMGKPGTQSVKYFQLTRAALDGPSGAITQRGGDNTVASVTHPTEKRKFSIAELKRICAFPDDFQLTGSYAQQWERLGRAVPPVMMFYIAKTVQAEVLDKCKPK
jgi:DNA (cytosine-5)-methyltransferase 1